MEATRSSNLRFLVCTDVASRGIDISHLTHVINFDFPESPEAYVHRTGRTGRAGRTGTAISLITPGDIGYLYILRLTYKIVPIQRQLPTKAELRTREELDLVEMFVEAFKSRAQIADDVLLARRLISHESAEYVVAGLLRDHLGSRPESNSTATDNRRSRLPVRVSDEVSSPVKTATTRAPVVSRTEPLVTEVAPRISSAKPPVAEVPTTHAGAGRRKRRQDSVSPEPTLPAVPDALEKEFDFQFTVGESIDRDIREASAPPTDVPSLSRKGRPDNNRVGEAATGPSDIGSEVFLNIGRRDGVNSEDVLALLAQRAIPKSAILHVSVRHHHTFVGVKRPNFHTVLGALDGASLAGRVARAEPARSNRD
jgi:hypothetical protein